MPTPAELIGGVLRRLTAAEEETREAPAPTPLLGRADLCVAMATYDDFDGVWFTIEAIRLFHPEVLDRISFLVLDNHPTGALAASLKRLDRIPNVRYVPFDGWRGTSVRDLVVRLADAEVVCCVDSHVLLAPGSLAALLGYFDQRPGSADLVQGVMLSDAPGGRHATHLEPRWGGLAYGTWGCDDAALQRGVPFEIEMHGLGLFACRPDAWPGLNPRLRGWGAEEGYLHEKVRRNGGRVVCHPGIGWLHRFDRPAGVPYPMELEERLRNFRIAFDELGWDAADVEAEFRLGLGDDATTDAIIERVGRQMCSPYLACDAIFGVADRRASRSDVVASFDADDVAWRVEVLRPASADGSTDPAARWEAAIALAERLARERRYADALVLEPRARLVDPGQLAGLAGVARSELDTVALEDGSQPRATYLTIDAVDGGAAPLRSSPSVSPPPTEIIDAPLAVVTASTGTVRRAVVTVLLAAEHLPFIREWCEHHLAQGWAIYLLDNTGSIGSVRRTSKHRRDLLDARRAVGDAPRFERGGHRLDDATASAGLRASIADLEVNVLAWQPRLPTGEIVHGQAEAYARFCECYRGIVEWAAFIDADEYLETAAGYDWDDLIERAERSDCPRIVLDGIAYEERWSDDGEPLDRNRLVSCGPQFQRSKNLVRIAEATRADVHWGWQFGTNRRVARPERTLFGFHHYFAQRPAGLLNVTEQPPASWEESVPVAVAPDAVSKAARSH